MEWWSESSTDTAHCRDRDFWTVAGGGLFGAPEKHWRERDRESVCGEGEFQMMVWKRKNWPIMDT